MNNTIPSFPRALYFPLYAKVNEFITGSRLPWPFSKLQPNRRNTRVYKLAFHGTFSQAFSSCPPEEEEYAAFAKRINISPEPPTLGAGLCNIANILAPSSFEPVSK